MKILLVQPYGSVTPPMGLCILVAELKQGGYTDTTIVDLLRTNIQSNVESPYRTKEYLMEKLKEQPDVVLLTASSQTFAEALEIARLARPYAKKIILGGNHATIFEERILEKVPYLDLVVYGEADETICKIMEHIEEDIEDFSDITGVCYRLKGKIHKSPPTPPIMDLDKLPFPDRGAVDLNSYLGALTIFTSRGCPFHCTFCSRPVSGRTFRGRSPKNVVDEIESIIVKYPHLAKKLDYNFTISDDNAGVNKQRLIGICDEIINRKLNIKLSLTSGLHVSSADLYLFTKLKQAGCNALWFGVESGNAQILKNIRKGATLDMIKKAVALAHEAGIESVSGHFIIGLEGETLQAARDTITFVTESGFDTVGFNHAAPTIGTPLWDWVLQHGKFLFKYEDIMDYSDFKHDHTEPQFETPEFTREERIQAYKEACVVMDSLSRKRLFALKNILKFISRVRSPADLVWAARRVYDVSTKTDLRRITLLKPSVRKRVKVQ
ncbi:radical SAM protein [Candidatus Woesearchaeota archaeon]|nr:radical SAM protein [Candidatus Woesearchaeota archaeon]